MASQGFFVIINGVENYRKHLERIDGEVLAILVAQPAAPLGGIASAVDWRLNSIISQTIALDKFNANAGSILLIPSNGKIKSKYVMMVGYGKNFKNELIKALKGLKINNFCIAIPKQFKKEIKQSTFDAESIKEYEIGEEKLFVVKGVEF